MIDLTINAHATSTQPQNPRRPPFHAAQTLVSLSALPFPWPTKVICILITRAPQQAYTKDRNDPCASHPNERASAADLLLSHARILRSDQTYVTQAFSTRDQAYRQLTVRPLPTQVTISQSWISLRPVPASSSCNVDFATPHLIHMLVDSSRRYLTEGSD